MIRNNLVLLILFSVLFASQTALAASRTPLKALVNAYKNYDFNNDGINEIDNLQIYYNRLSEFNAVSQSQLLSEMSLRQGSPVVLVIVEKRLFEHVASSDEDYDLYNFKTRLDNLRNDLKREGKNPHFVVADLYDGVIHQDGLTLLALRRFIKDVYRVSQNNMEGVLLIGSFPEAQLVHRYLWKRTDAKVINGVDAPERGWLRIIPEIRAAKADIVLGDLDGNWEDIYVQPETNISYFRGIPHAQHGNDWHQSNRNILFSSTETGTKKFEDFFFLDDGNYEIRETRVFRRPFSSQNLVLNSKVLRYQKEHTNLEINSTDSSNVNKIAIPEIMISRINARHIALNPYSSNQNYVATDEHGVPQVVSHRTSIRWKRNADLERKLLIEYLDQNHKFRNGGYNHYPFRATGIASDRYDSRSSTSYADSAHSEFESPLDGTQHATLVDYVRWLKEPVTLRRVKAHSDSKNSYFPYPEVDLSVFPKYFRRRMKESIDQRRTTALENEVGIHFFNWHSDLKTGTRTPSLRKHLNGKANFHLMRSLYENDTLRDVPPSFYIHSGCNLLSHHNSHTHRYSHKSYGVMQNAESIMFYGKALTIIGRAKVFNDAPMGNDLNNILDNHNEYGSIWKNYFIQESGEESIADHPAANKRAYSWSILGDWTLGIRYSETNNFDYEVGQKFSRPEFRRFTPRFNYGRW